MRRLAQYALECADDVAVSGAHVEQALEEMRFSGTALKRALLGASRRK